MKFRTNAQKKRIDVWLIYRCSACDEVWNLPIFERVATGDIAPDAFDAIARNDPAPGAAPRVRSRAAGAPRRRVRAAGDFDPQVAD